MAELWSEWSALIAGYVPHLLGALLILVLGWLAALVLGGAVRKGLEKSGLGTKLGVWIAGDKPGSDFDFPRVAGRTTFYLAMLFVAMAFLQAVGLTIVTEPINGLLTRLFEFAPNLLAAAGLFLAAWAIASVVRMVLNRVFDATRLDEKFAAGAALDGDKPAGLSRSLADAAYWLVLFFFLPAILGALSMEGLLDPVKSMTGQILAFLPNLFGAGLILLVGWFVARVVRRVMVNLLTVAGADHFGEKIGLGAIFGSTGLSTVIGAVAYVMILLPVAISALRALELDAVTGPASHMLDIIWGSLPSIFAAVLVAGFSYIVGRAVAGLVTNILTDTGFNNIAMRLRLAKQAPAAGTMLPAELVGHIVLVAILLFAAMEAFDLVGFHAMSAMIGEIAGFAGHVALGLVLFAGGLWIANLVGDVVRGSAAANARLLSVTARVAVLMLAGAVALRQMGIADGIITLAFGLVVGAAAIAAAIAFGVGGRHYAANQIEQWQHRARGQSGEGSNVA